MNCVGTFDYAVASLLGDPSVSSDGAEGGLNTDPNDRGNAGGKATNYGMTQPFYDRFCREFLRVSPRQVRLASETEARMAYYELIWMDRRINAQGVAREAPATSLVYFDGAVNHGGYMTYELQREVGAHPDGWCGSATLAAVRLKVSRIKDDGLAARMLTRRRAIYERQPDYAYWGKGWRNRLNDLARRADLAWHWHT